MSEYIDNGSLLGWLIDRIREQVEIYRQNKDKEILNNPASLSAESILPGFSLDLVKINYGKPRRY